MHMYEYGALNKTCGYTNWLVTLAYWRYIIFGSGEFWYSWTAFEFIA